MAQQLAPTGHISIGRSRFASLSASIPQGIRNDGEILTPSQWSQGITYNCPKDVATTRSTGCASCGVGVRCWPDPCDTPIGKATPIDLGVISGCKEHCSVEDWAARNREQIDAAADHLLARFLWNGIAGEDAAGVPFVVSEQTTITQAGLLLGSTSSLESALSEALAGLDAQSFFGTAVLWVPHAMLGYRNSNAWTERGDLLFFNGHPVVGIRGPFLPGPGPIPPIGRFVAATGGVEWDVQVLPDATIDTSDPAKCGWVQGALSRRMGIIRVACWPVPQIVQVA